MEKHTDTPLANVAIKKRNPAWSREELILALELYLKNRNSLPGPKAVEVALLSEFLSTVGRTLGRNKSATYRNANGVAMKLQNFKRFDPIYINEGKIGLSRGNKHEQVLWDEFASDEALLSAVVLAIRTTVRVPSDDGELPPEL